MTFTLDNLGIAYRKAKVDLYYSTNPNLGAIAEYEENLQENLQHLLGNLLGEDETWVTDPAFLGNWTVATKNLKTPELPTNSVIFSSPDDEWRNICKLANLNPDFSKPIAEFRVMADVSLNFHVLSALWIIEVGHLYDSKLSESAYGNRLRRNASNGINKFALGSFAPYLGPFQRWRDKGIETMQVALEAGKKVVALTADVSSFYHELNPSFMLTQAFHTAANVTLSKNQQKLHNLFILALQSWAAATPLKRGLPVGLPASAIVANIALLELDLAIASEVMPLYYGRYVDDIILVLENGANFETTYEFWEWIFVRVKLLRWENAETKQVIKFEPDYLKDSQIKFGNDKNKLFLLAGEHGKILVDSILRQIRHRASEWRSLPHLPMHAEHVGTDLVKATQNNGEDADNLRKTDSLTMRRSGFAIKLRDFEAYERDLMPDSWKKHRHAFLRAFTQHVVVLPHFFELATYLPRVIKLATACEDFWHVVKIAERLKKISAEIEDNCKIEIKACAMEQNPPPKEILGRWRQQLYHSVVESIVAAFPPQLSNSGKKMWLELFDDLQSVLNSPALSSVSIIRHQHARLFSYDLAHMPFRFIGLPQEMIAQRGIPNKSIVKNYSAAPPVPQVLIDGIESLAHLLKLPVSHPNGLLFPVRPLSLAEIFVMMPDAFSGSRFELLRSMVLAARGFNLSDKMPKVDKQGILQIPESKSKSKFGIAVSSWNTRHDSWIAAVMQADDPDIERYTRLSQLINSAISSRRNTSYFILPELAMPAKWFMRISQKLRKSNISFITGVEYLHASKSRVRNQIWASFSHDGLGFPSTMIYRQDKQKPALHEEQELRRLNGVEMKPHKTWSTPPIIQHGGFRFSMLVCSELTNISYRTALRGKVDALFVPEWNQDTETFNALIESTALDIHAYIVQCNDRRYGDSRIRAPYKDSWRRDILRVKGGTSDYCICGDIDIHSLRQFQSSHRSPIGPFKPVPDGFVMSYCRKILPSED